MSSHRAGAPRWLASVLILLLVATVFAPVDAAAQSTATTTAALNLRAGPSTGHPIIAVMPSGASVIVTGGGQAGFLPVSWNGSNGWASADYLSTGAAAAPSPTGSATTTSALNFRSGPGTSYGIITVIPAGTAVTLNGESSGGFLSISYNGTAGWVSGDYVSSGASAPAPSPVTGTARTTAALNLRSGPGTSNTALTVIPAGATVNLTGESANGFLSVSYNGIAGWSAADFLLTGTSEPVAANPAPAPVTGTATATANVYLRSGPGTSNAALTIIPAGSTVSITGSTQNGFLPVTFNGVSGWSAADFLSTSGTPSVPAPAPVPVGQMTTTANLNLRSGATLGATVLTVIPAGTSVTVTGAAQGGFLPVTYGGQAGWAAADFLRDPATTPDPAPSPGGGSGLIWPVSGGTWTIIQGYNGGSHQNRSSTAQYYYALDIARVDGNTAGQSVYAPASGTIQWLDPASGGIAINMGNGYMVAMFHATFDSSLARGQTVSQGQYLGTVSGPGGAGYASTPHIDMTLWQSSDGRSRSATPYTGGNSISGMSFPDVGGWNQHSGTQFNP